MKKLLPLFALIILAACSKEKNQNNQEQQQQSQQTITQDSRLFGSWVLDSNAIDTLHIINKKDSLHMPVWLLLLSDSVCYFKDSVTCYAYVSYANNFLEEPIIVQWGNAYNDSITLYSAGTPLGSYGYTINDKNILSILPPKTSKQAVYWFHRK